MAPLAAKAPTWVVSVFLFWEEAHAESGFGGQKEIRIMNGRRGCAKGSGHNVFVEYLGRGYGCELDSGGLSCPSRKPTSGKDPAWTRSARNRLPGFEGWKGCVGEAGGWGEVDGGGMRMRTGNGNGTGTGGTRTVASFWLYEDYSVRGPFWSGWIGWTSSFGVSGVTPAIRSHAPLRQSGLSQCDSFQWTGRAAYPLTAR